MTTIAFDGETMAADSRQTGTYIDRIQSQKIYQTNGAVIGLAGSSAPGLVFLRWHKDQTKPKPDISVLDGMECLVVRGNQVYFYDKHCEAIPVGSPAAVGSGADIAMGAMLAGSSAVEAVKIAMKLDIHTGGKVRSVKIK